MALLQEVQNRLIREARKHELCLPGHEYEYANETIMAWNNLQLLEAISLELDDEV